MAKHESGGLPVEHLSVPGATGSPFHAYTAEQTFYLADRFPTGHWEKCRCPIAFDDAEEDD